MPVILTMVTPPTTNRFLFRVYDNAKGIPIPNRLPFEQTYQVGTSYKGMQAKIDYEQPVGKNQKHGCIWPGG